MVSELAASRTAMLAAAARAAHLFDHGPRALLADWMAWPLLGADGDDVLAAGRAITGDLGVPFATWMAARSRLSEDWLTASGAQQHVILGAGLDSSAWRQSADIRVFEVDRPGTQAWKRSRVAALGLSDPVGLVWVAVDFEQERLADALAASGLDDEQPVFVSWLGVVPYLSTDAIAATLRELPACSLAVNYSPPEDSWDDEVRILATTLQTRVAAMGEPWLSLLSPEDFTALLNESGFTVIQDVGSSDIERRYGLQAASFERIALARKNH